jgi:protein-S-isoprenylcysteine O-methyltransferase Ste14
MIFYNLLQDDLMPIKKEIMVTKGNQSLFEGIFPPPLIVLALLIAGSGLQWQIPLAFQKQYRDYWLIIGILLIVFSGLLAFFASRIMRSQRTPVNFNKPTIMIVKKGPFRFTRNPLYLSLLMLYAGIGIMINSLWFVLLLFFLFFFLRRVILLEEKYLEHHFSSEYMLYKSAVRRWL